MSKISSEVGLQKYLKFDRIRVKSGPKKRQKLVATFSKIGPKNVKHSLLKRQKWVRTRQT